MRLVKNEGDGGSESVMEVGEEEKDRKVATGQRMVDNEVRVWLD